MHPFISIVVVLILAAFAAGLGVDHLITSNAKRKVGDAGWRHLFIGGGLITVAICICLFVALRVEVLFNLMRGI